jgi:hypothetical protein
MLFKCNVLLVPDWRFWVTGVIANQIALQENIDAIICSEPVLNEVLAEFGPDFPLRLDVVHFLTPHIATRQFSKFADHAACVATRLRFASARSGSRLSPLLPLSPEPSEHCQAGFSVR